ncbi:MAG: DUF1016 family protein, partial [Bacteroidales bacterium]|nr:DUF1016 family protein [Candidatus Sodaliphilus limicaballi]
MQLAKCKEIVCIFAPENIHQRTNTYIGMANDNNNIQLTIIDADYQQWLQQLKARYRQAQIKAASRVNEELLRYYWQLGADIDARGDENRYGAGFYEKLSHDLTEMMPGVDGFTRKNLQNATRFYRFYSTYANQKQFVSISQDEGDTQNRKQFVSKLEQTPDEAIFRIPWGHHIVILGKCANNQEKALFYVHKTLENQWSRAMLLNMMGDKDGNGGLYEAQGKALTNFSETLPKPDTDLARDILKDPYNLQFLRLYENYQEQDLQLALEQNIVQFLLELGNG